MTNELEKLHSVSRGGVRETEGSWDLLGVRPESQGGPARGNLRDPQ